MENVILVIHLLLAVSIIGLVLLQRSEGGGLGIGGSGGLGSFATVGQTANALTRATAICAAGFFTTSIILAILAGTHHKSSVLDSLDAPPAAVETDAKATEGSKPSSMPTDKHGDESGEKLDSKAATSDKEVPKAEDKPKPQDGAPSAPISQ